MKRIRIIKAITICFVFFIIGISIIQASQTFSQPDATKYQRAHSQMKTKESTGTEYTSKTDDENFDRMDLFRNNSDESLGRLVESLAKRYPFLDKMGKEFGMTKDKAVHILKTTECTLIFQMLSTYIHDVFI